MAWKTFKTLVALFLGILGLIVPGISVQGLSNLGLSVPALRVSRLSVPGLGFPGLRAQGLGVSVLKVQSCKLYNNKYMIALTQIANTEIYAFITILVFKLLSCKVLFINRKNNRNCQKVGNFLRKLQMRIFRDTFETQTRSCVSAFSICMTVLLSVPGLSVPELSVLALGVAGVYVSSLSLMVLCVSG